MSDLRATAASFISGRNGNTGAENSGDTQYSDHPVIFHHEFTLGESREAFRPGSYIVETAEEIHEAAGHSAHVRKSCVLIVPTASGTRSVHVSSHELDAALEADAAMQQLGARNENPDRPSAEGVARNATQVASQSELDRYGIERVPADVFVWRGYKYTNASDAIAAATRANGA